MKEGWKQVKEVCGGGGINLENLFCSALYEGWVGPLWGRMGMLLCQEALGETGEAESKHVPTNTLARREEPIVTTPNPVCPGWMGSGLGPTFILGWVGNWMWNSTRDGKPWKTLPKVDGETQKGQDTRKDRGQERG